MHPREARQAQVTRLGAGDIFFASAGAGHVAHPSGEARILMAGHEGSA
ncbi:hypothetical protein [Solilutibacter pythonis]|nr:hypothetical protein [Lysobacter pythonis]